VCTIVPHPRATPLPDGLIEVLLHRVAAVGSKAEDVVVRCHDAHSNDVAELRFPDGRALMVKRGRYPWVAERFETSRLASKLLRERADPVVPTPLPLPDGLDERPVEVYWRIPLPTLEELWPGLSPRGREGALRSLGRLIRRVHDVRLPGYGPLRAAAGPPVPLSDHLRGDLEERLLPAVAYGWPEARRDVEGLAAAVPTLAERLEGREATLVHNDLHLGNVLCEADGDGVRCVGLLDLEAASAAPPESDLAVAQVHHGPLFCHPLPEGWSRWLLEGYGSEPDPLALSFYRAYHLANMGYYSALVGHDVHARDVARALGEEVRALSATA
jgi:hypothetical protein